MSIQIAKFVAANATIEAVRYTAQFLKINGEVPKESIGLLVEGLDSYIKTYDEAIKSLEAIEERRNAENKI